MVMLLATVVGVQPKNINPTNQLVPGCTSLRTDEYIPVDRSLQALGFSDDIDNGIEDRGEEEKAKDLSGEVEFEVERLTVERLR